MVLLIAVSQKKLSRGNEARWERRGIFMKHAVSHKQIEQRTLRTEATRANLFRTFRPPAFVAALFIFIAMVASQGNAQTDGIMVLQNMTTPRGGVWLANSTPATPPGGHFWRQCGPLCF
jgi:hypothetical protein